MTLFQFLWAFFPFFLSFFPFFFFAHHLFCSRSSRALWGPERLSVPRYTDPRSHHHHRLLLLFLTFALFTKEELTKPQGAPPSAERANRIWPGSVTGASADLRALLQQPAPPPSSPTPPPRSSRRPVWSWERSAGEERPRAPLQPVVRSGPQGLEAWKPLPPAPSNSSHQFGPRCQPSFQHSRRFAAGFYMIPNLTLLFGPIRPP